MHDEGSGAAASGSGDPQELTELEATIRNSAADMETAKQRLAKETSEHHRRVHRSSSLRSAARVSATMNGLLNA